MNAEFAINLLNAIFIGILLGGFYAAVSVGLTVAFGLLDIPYVAHPSFVVLGGYGAIGLGTLGLDPLISGVILAPAFFVVGQGLYRLYHATFERRTADAALRGIIFFFGITFILEAAISIVFGSDLTIVDAWYFGKSLRMGEFRVPLRMVLVCGCGLGMLLVVDVYLNGTFIGRAIKAVAQDQTALRVCGADPIRIKRLAFSIATATASFAGALLVVIGPVEPFLGRVYLGKAFAIAILAGAGSIRGTLIASLVLGVTESIVLATAGTAWVPAVAFALLLVILAVRPQGVFGR